MIFEIRKSKNGYILKVTYKAENPDEADEVVFQERYDEDDEIECFADFLRKLCDEYGPTTSRYSPKRIYLRVEPGDKYDPPQPRKRRGRTAG